MNPDKRPLFALAASAIAATSLFGATQMWSPAEGSTLWDLATANWDDGAVWGGEGITNSAVFAAAEGGALAVAGDFDGALSAADAACTEDPKNVYNFLNRADIYWMKGDLAAAIADASQAVAADEKNADGYFMRAILSDEAGDRDGALADYLKVHELVPASERIPDEYLKEIDAKAYDARVKKREEAAKAAAEEKKKTAEAKKTDEQQSSTEKPQKEQKPTEKNEK